MYRFRALLLLLLVAFVATMPVSAHASDLNLPILNPNFHIVPDAQELDPSCPANAPLGFAGFLQLVQNLMNASVSVGLLVITLTIAYAGAILMLSATNPENKSKAKSMISNALIGFVIVLAAWLIVDFVMTTLYVGQDGQNKTFGPWNAVLTGGNYCIIGKENEALYTGATAPGQGSVSTGGTTSTSGGVLTTTGKGACNATEIQNAATAGGVRMPNSEASLLACLAGPESGCGSIMKNYNWNAAKSPPPSTAYGPFQITLKGNSTCFDNQVCSNAAGVTGKLNCASAFDSKGYAIPGATLQQCQKAAANLSCSAVAAHCVYLKQGSSAWTADKNKAKQQACIAKNGG